MVPVEDQQGLFVQAGPLQPGHELADGLVQVVGRLHVAIDRVVVGVRLGNGRVLLVQVIWVVVGDGDQLQIKRLGQFSDILGRLLEEDLVLQAVAQVPGILVIVVVQGHEVLVAKRLVGVVPVPEAPAAPVHDGCRIAAFLLEDSRHGFKDIAGPIGCHGRPALHPEEGVFQHHFRVRGLPLADLVEEVVKSQGILGVVELVQVGGDLLALPLVVNQELLEGLQVDHDHVLALGHARVLGIWRHAVLLEVLLDGRQIRALGVGHLGIGLGRLDPVIDRIFIDPQVLDDIVVVKSPRQ